MKSLRFLMRIGFVLTLAACAGNAPLPDVQNSYSQAEAVETTANLTAYRDPAGRYEVGYPPEWQMVQADDSADVTHFVDLVLSDPTQRTAVTVVVQRHSNNLTEVANSAQETISSQAGVTDFAVLGESGVEVNGVRGIERQLRYALAGVKLSQRVVYLVNEKHTYAISLMVPSERFDQTQAIFVEMLRSFKGKLE